jgi:hypothetical protein
LVQNAATLEPIRSSANVRVFGLAENAPIIPVQRERLEPTAPRDLIAELI